MMPSKNNTGHWSSYKPFDPSEHFGFLYCIHNKEHKRFYLGKKQFFHGGKKKSRTYGKEMAWRTYQGSSVHVKNDIKQIGADKFEFEIIDLYQTKGGLYYSEAFLQMLTDSMIWHCDKGVPKSYNRQIAAIRFVPKEIPTDRTRDYAKEIKRRYK
jgi:hypothetical protein